MVESLMLVALGFLIATLFALIAAQFVWRRAVKVTTRRLEGDTNAEEAKQAIERLASIEIQLQDKHLEVRALAGRNAEVEGALAVASQEAQSLRDEIAALHASYDAARADAELHARNVAALQSRIAELEAAAAAEIARQGDVAVQLKTLGEKAARLVHEMSGIFDQAGNTQSLEAAIARPAPQPAAAAPAPARLTPFPIDAEDGEDAQRLAEIKASLSSFSEGGEALPDLDEAADGDSGDDETPLPNERFLAERIRALEAGVAS
jgi:hypothetical protein